MRPRVCIQLLNDRPLNPLTPANDHLGLLPVRDALCDLALRVQGLRATVGVFGGSGCGKSTLLRAVEAKRALRCACAIAGLTQPAFREFLRTMAAIWPAVSAQAAHELPPVALTASAAASQ